MKAKPQKLVLANARAHAAKTARWQKKFLKALAERPSVTLACTAAHVSRDCAYDNRKRSPEFAARWQAALDQSVDDLETRAFDLAMHGDADSNATARLIEFLLKAHRREIYGDKSEVAFAGGIVILPAKREGPP
jgi:hypothetical protein